MTHIPLTILKLTLSTIAIAVNIAIIVKTYGMIDFDCPPAMTMTFAVWATVADWVFLVKLWQIKPITERTKP